MAREMTAYQRGVQERLRRAELAAAEAGARVAQERKTRHVTLALVFSTFPRNREIIAK